MKKLLFSTLIISSSIFAQDYSKMMEDPNVNFYDIQESFNTYFEGKEYVKGNGFKQFKRWENFTSPRVYPSGNRIPGKQIWKEYETFTRQFNRVSSSRTANWTAVGPTTIANGNGGYSPGLGRVNTVAQDPNNANILFVGVPQGGIWKSTNAGTSWTPVTDDLPVSGISDITIDPNNTSVIYACTGDGDGSDSYGIGVLKSTDGGDTWVTTSLIWELGMDITARRLIISHANSNHLYVTTSSGVYKSIDAGTHWFLLKTGSFRDLEMHPTNSDIIYIANSKVYYSTDAGESFSVASGISGGATRVELAVSPIASAANWIYAIAGESSGGLQAFYQSTNSGITFTQKMDSPNILSSDSDGGGTGGQAWYDLAITCDPNNANTVYVGGVNVWKTTNAGSSFDIITHWSLGTNWVEYLHADIHTLEFFGNNFYAGSDGGVAKSTNFGTDWNDLSDGLQNSQFYEIDVMPSNVNKLIGGSQDNGSMRIDGNNAVQIRGGDGMNCKFHRSNANVWFYEWQYGGVHRTTNGGNNFDYIKPNAADDGAWNTPFETSPTNHNTIYIGYVNLFKSTNLGDNYSEIDVPGNGNINEIAIFNGNDNSIAVSKDNALLLSTNNGAAWSPVSGLPNLAITSMIYHPSNSLEMWVVFSGFNDGSKVFHTINGGSNWENISLNLPNVPVNTIVYEPGSNNGVYIGTDMGVFYKNDDLGNWVSYSEGLPVTVITDLVYHESTDVLFAGTYGRGIYKTAAYVASSNVPEADFEASLEKVCVDQSINFADLSAHHEPGWTWSFQNGTPATSTEQYPSVSWDTPGTYEVSLSVSNANGSATETKSSFITVYDTTGNALPYFEGFEAYGTIDESDLLLNAVNNVIGWEISSTAAATGNKSAYLNNNIAFPSSTYTMTTPSIDLSGEEDVVLTFKYAFAKKNANSNDRLQVYTSNNCGATWSLRKNINVGDLATSADIVEDFVPTSGEWVTAQVDNITSQFFVENFKMRFFFLSSGGNNIFLDDINLTSVQSIDEQKLNQLSVYPNPFSDQISIIGQDGEAVDFELMSIDGKLLKKGSVISGEISTNDIQAGIYLLRMRIGDEMKEVKLVKN